MTENVFTRDHIREHIRRYQEAGAIQNGRRIVKVCDEKGDARPSGSEGVILESFGPFLGMFTYSVAWDEIPTTPCAVLGYMIREKTKAN